MYSPDTNCLGEFNKIVLHDLMEIRQFQDIDLKFIIDIGANIGIVTVFTKILFPKAKIIAIEPDSQSFDCLTKNTSFISDIYREKKAFGNGKKCKVVLRGKRFIDRYTVEDEDGDVDSITLKQIFKKYKINTSSKYFIKSDCEGAEKYFIRDEYCEKVIEKSTIFFMEVHFNSEATPMFETTWQTYNNWVNDNFYKSHKIEYYKSNKRGGYGHYLLSNRRVLANDT